MLENLYVLNFCGILGSSFIRQYNKACGLIESLESELHDLYIQLAGAGFTVDDGVVLQWTEEEKEFFQKQPRGSKG